MATVTLSADAASVIEGASFTVSVELEPPSGGLECNLTVTLTITDGTTSKTTV